MDLSGDTAGLPLILFAMMLPYIVIKLRDKYPQLRVLR